MPAARSPRFLLALLPVVTLLAACGSDDGGGDATVAVTTAAATAAAVAGPSPATSVTLIDVRTPEEFASGHLAGAVNYSVEDGTLEAKLATLDPSASYAVYCRSGRRSALAAELMAGKGFTAVDDLGAMDAAATATGLAVVTG